MSRPEPRPALQRSGDGSVHPAAPRVATEQHIHPAPHAPAAATRQSKKSKGAKTIDRAADAAGPVDALATFTGKPVSLTVSVPKDLRKQVRRIAESADATVDDVVAKALATLVSKTG